MLALLAAAPAFAADLAYPPTDPEEPAPTRIEREERLEEQIPPVLPQVGPVLESPRFAAGPRFAPPPEEFRTIVKRRIDEDGAEVVRRVRICDEVAYPPPRPHVRPSFYDPVPPVDVPDGRFDGPQRW